ncbi:MAG: CoA-binding protein [Proteobacteria bacterium]|nr:CoA-binding protein [Desulfobulbaceae bacterium]MBU4153094.1 CoA-binding protein [Pseudomonadota bacterium]MDP2106585.1 CoA-binding protein [Desulfobulbaceae bacterium]
MIPIVSGQDTDLVRILREANTIAVVGLSPKHERPSNQVAAYLLAAGYHVIPVNPGHTQILGLQTYPDLASIPVPVDIVDIFRNAKEVPALVEAAIAIKAKAVWMQLGIIHEEAAAKARAAGLIVVMNRCLKIDHQQFGR